MVHWCVKHLRHLTSSIYPSSASKNGLDLQRATAAHRTTTMLSFPTILNKIDEKVVPPPSPKIKDVKMARFGFCAASSLIWGRGGWGLLFHFILSKIVGRTGCIKLNWRPRLLQTKARGPHVLIRKTPRSNRKWSCSIYMTTDPGD